MIVYLSKPAYFNREPPRSDTLFGAICWAVRLLYNERFLDDWLSRFDRGDPPFVLSSSFPFAQLDSGVQHFFPTAVQPPPYLEAKTTEEYEALKQLKKIAWVTQDVFNQMLGGLTLEDIYEDRLSQEQHRFHVHSNLLSTSAEWNQGVVESAEIARNAINRLSGAVLEGHLFYSEISTVKTDGLYFLIRCFGGDQDKTESVIRAAVRFLADKGIGGDASIGRGHFTADFAEFDHVKPFTEPKGSWAVTLSLLHPSAADRSFFATVKDQISGRVERRKGFIESSYHITRRIWKPTLFMLSEGTTFPIDLTRGKNQVYGSVYRDDRGDELPFILRINGYAYTVRMQEREGGGQA